MPTLAHRLRRLTVYFLAISLALPIGFVSLAKLLLFMAALMVLLGRAANPASSHRRPVATQWVVLAAVFGMALSMAWGEAARPEALSALAKHGKLLTIILLLIMIKHRDEARNALMLWAAGQVVLAGSTLLLAWGVSLPWQTSRQPHFHAVFSTYLDQSMMATVLAAVAWHLRGELPKRFALPCALFTSGLALASVFLVFPGRTAHLMGVVLICMAIAWHLPLPSKRSQILLAPLLVAMVVALASLSPQVRERAGQAMQEAQQFSTAGDTSTSSGIRLNLWRRSVEAIAEQPVLGHGVGSWNQVYARMENQGAVNTPLVWLGNPHQEFLLWGVEFGLAGMSILALTLGTMWRQARQFEMGNRRALQSVIAALLVASMFNSVLFDALIGDFFCTVLGLLLALGLSPQAETHTAEP